MASSTSKSSGWGPCPKLRSSAMRSQSSMTTIEGCSALAMAAASAILASDPPESKIAVVPSLWLSKYRTVWVLPVPGLPYSRMPLLRCCP